MKSNKALDRDKDGVACTAGAGEVASLLVHETKASTSSPDKAGTYGSLACAHPHPVQRLRRSTAVERVGPLAANEAWFREINDQIETHALKLGSERARYDFVCECADIDCAERMPLTLAEYEHVRAHPARFAVKPGHVHAELAEVVEHESFWIIERTGPAAGLVRPRDA